MPNASQKNSWDDFYESYDGKFDETNMLHIIIDISFKNEIESLGYRPQSPNENWHKPVEGEYKSDDSGNLVIIHSCPDREIFHVDIEEFLEDLFINQEWTVDVSLSVMWDNLWFIESLSKYRIFFPNRGIIYTVMLMLISCPCYEVSNWLS